MRYLTMLFGLAFGFAIMFGCSSAEKKEARKFLQSELPLTIQAIDAYRSELRSASADGVTTAEESQRLDAARQSLEQAFGRILKKLEEQRE